MRKFYQVICRAIGGLKRIANHLYWRAYRFFLVHPQVAQSPRSLLFVCKGNICRSPFAEALARKCLPDSLAIECRSAGIEVGLSEGCPSETLAAAERFGIDLSFHRSRRIDLNQVAGADMILTMEVWQLSRLRNIFPQHKEKMFLMSFFDGSSQGKADGASLTDIRDPYGRELDDFMECFEKIDACIRGIFSSIGATIIVSSTDKSMAAARPSCQQADLSETLREQGAKDP